MRHGINAAWIVVSDWWLNRKIYGARWPRHRPLSCGWVSHWEVLSVAITMLCSPKMGRSVTRVASVFSSSKYLSFYIRASVLDLLNGTNRQRNSCKKNSCISISHHQWCGLRPSVLEQDRTETQKIWCWCWSWSCRSGVVLCYETRSCYARRHNDREGHGSFSGTIYSFSILCLEHHYCGDQSGVYLLKS